jgi:hypothetical protein
MNEHGSVGIALLIPNLGTGWGRMVNFTPRPIYPGEKTPSIHWIEI